MIAQARWTSLIPDVLFMLAVGFSLGLLAGVLNAPQSALVAVPILLALFNAYNRQLKVNRGIQRGLLFGMLGGAVLGLGGFLLSVVLVEGAIVNVLSGALFGTALGLSLGALVGLITRVEVNEGDRWYTRIFLLVGSVLLGALLAAGVGFIAGLFLGAVAQSLWGALLAMVAGGVVGGYLGSYFHTLRMVLLFVGLGVLATAVSSWLGGPFSGLVLGSIAGSFAPILLVASIGAWGGLVSRGPKAMVIEALEAPTEMLQQGAVPFLLPAIITGAIVGTSASGPGGLVVLMVALATLGMGLGVISDINGRPGARITFRFIIETAMMGADEWPLRRIINYLWGGNRRRVLLTAFAGGALGLGGVLAGLFMAQKFWQPFF
jgi:hypothetical protein